MIENGRILTGCDTCDFNMQNDEGSCGAGVEHINDIKDGCPNYKMMFTCFCANHAQYDQYTGQLKQLKW